MLKPVVMIIPTASLTSKPKNGGRVISYRGQCDKDKSRELCVVRDFGFHHFSSC